MKIAYLDCPSGLSGDMVLGALVDAGVELSAVQAAVDSLKLPSCRLTAVEVKRKGFRALKLSVEHEPEHAHRHLHHITDMIDASAMTARQKDLAKRIFTRLGEAEAKVHGTTLRKVHFHEVGAVDSIADVCGAAVAWDLLEVERVECSPVPTGRGFIEIAHGRCSIPAPATAELLHGVPLAESTVDAELTTPTGAAIAAVVADAFGPLPAMTIERIGCGAGDRDFPTQPNILRLLVGRTAERAPGDRVWQLETNLDDVSGEVIGYAIERLRALGALDVFTTAIQMKKNRPGVMLSVLCRAAEVERIEAALFAETGTLGIRRRQVERHVVERRVHTVATPWGEIAGKLGWTAGREPVFSPEYEACRRAAEAHGVPLKTVMDAAARAYAERPPTADA